MSKVDVSVVMAEYNTKEKDLDATIKSILHQTFKNFEFIIVDDCGKNNLDEIVKRYNDKRIKIVKNDRNRGFVYSLNHGIKEAKGKYIVRMDTDDISDLTRIEKLYNYIESHPEYAVVGTKALEFSGNQEFGILGKAGEKNKKDIMKGNIIIHASAIIKKEALCKIGYYKEYRRAEDLVLWCELLLAGYKLYTIDEVLYKYRTNPQDYKKRKLKCRTGEIKARLIYYPKMGASLTDYLHIIKSIISGIMPIWFIRYYRKKFVLNK